MQNQRQSADIPGVTRAASPEPIAGRPVRVAFVVHVMQVAGAEVLVTETIRRLETAIEPVVLCLDAIGPLGEELQRAGVPVIALGRKSGLDWATAGAIARQVRERDLDVVHAHQYTPFFYGGLGAWWAGRQTKVIFTEHGRHYPDVVSPKRRLANRLVLRRLADRVTAVCEFSARALAVNDGFEAESVEVIENGIDVERYDAVADRRALREQLNLDATRRYIACIARFHPVKDHHMLIEAFARVARDLPDVDLLLVGDGPLRPDLQAQVAAIDLQSRVRFMGVRSDVPEILKAVDVFALTSVSEAASITLLEAMATGLPVVVTNVGGNPEIVRAGIDGELVPRGDAAEMGDALRKVLTHSTLARSMGLNGAQQVRERYRLDRTIERYARIYKDLQAERAQGST